MTKPCGCRVTVLVVAVAVAVVTAVCIFDLFKLLAGIGLVAAGIETFWLLCKLRRRSKAA